MASLSTKKHNSMFCHDLFYEWYKKFKIPANVPEYPNESLKDWFFTQEKLDRIIDLARSIIDSKSEYILIRGVAQTALFNKEIFEIQNDKIQQNPVNIDKWLALLVGNILYNNEKQSQYFNSTLDNYESLFEMIRNWNYLSISDSSPFWAKSLFKGIRMDNNIDDYNFSNVNISGINFSHSYLKNINLSSSKLSGCIFEDVTFEDVDLSFCDLTNSKFSEINSITGTIDLGFCQLSPEVFLPPQLARKFFDSGFMGNQKSYIPENGFSTIHQLFATIQGFLDFGIRNNLFVKEECSTWFHFETMHLESIFEKKLCIFDELAVEM
jgi:hypothetical protein